MKRRLIAWFFAAIVGLAPAATHRMLPEGPPPERRVAPQPVRDPDADATEQPIEYVAAHAPSPAAADGHA